jgi:MHS family proline/betaine transporter-like MFS transporter
MSQSLTKEQKEAVGLLSIGTFLEYFDLMLYVHMAVLLNELFFPKTDPHTTALISAFAFCSTYILRPLGALVFGYIGDNIGRKATVMITTSMMALSCLVMANVPTYAQIGISASWIVTICRIVQGISSMGEFIGAEIYLTEYIKPPFQYPAVSFLTVSSTSGTMAALGVATLVTSYGLNWRMAFWVGIIIAGIGIVARTALRETPDFVDAKLMIKNNFEQSGINQDELRQNIIYTHPDGSNKAALAYFFIQCGWPVCFYLAYVHSANILKYTFNFSAQEIISHNFQVAIMQFIADLAMTYLCSKIHPLKISKFRLIVFTLFVIMLPYMLFNVQNSFQMFLIQSFLVIFGLASGPSSPVFLKRFPVFGRFTYSSFIYAISRAFIYLISSFGLVYLIEWFNHHGLLIIVIPIIISYAVALRYFENLEKAEGNL